MSGAIAVPVGDTIHFFARTHTPSTAANVAADSTPTYAIYEEDSDTAILSGNMTARAALTGAYRGSAVASSGNGVEAGKFYEVAVTAVVGGVTSSEVVLSFRAVAAETVAGVPSADVTAWGGNATQIGVNIDGYPAIALGSTQHTGNMALGTMEVTGNYTIGGTMLVSDNFTVGLVTSLNVINASALAVTGNLSVGNMTASGTISRGGTALSTLTAAQVNSEADTALSDAGVTSTRMGYVDNLQNGNVALESTAQSILTDTAEIGVAGAGLTAINLPDQTMNITGNLSGSVGSVTGNVNAAVVSMGNDTITANAIASSAVSEIQSGLSTYDGSDTSGVTTLLTRIPGNVTITAGRVVADATAISGNSTAADNVEANIGNLDASVSSRGTYDGGDITGNLSGTVGSVTGTVGGIAGTITTLDALDTAQDAQHATTQAATTAIEVDTQDIQSRIPAALVGGRMDATVDATGMETGAIDAILTRQMTESYAADGAAPTLAQALMLIQQTLGDFAISGTTLTVKRVDGATTAATFTLDDASAPTSITRAS